MPTGARDTHRRPTAPRHTAATRHNERAFPPHTAEAASQARDPTRPQQAPGVLASDAGSAAQADAAVGEAGVGVWRGHAPVKWK